MGEVYLRPTAFVDSPQRFDGETARLAGTMLWFSQIEVIQDSGISHVALSDWDAASSKLPAKAQQIYANLIAPRAPLQMGARTIRFDHPQVMGILNITPDSFSDGGKHGDNVDAAVASGIEMSVAGASIIDVGGESTRPGAALVWEGDEIARIEPVIAKLAHAGTAISVDTRKAAVMKAAFNAGAAMVNDISALLYDDQSLRAATAMGVPVCLMHAPSQTSDPHKNTGYQNVVTEVYDFLESRIEACIAAGIAREKIIVDPGIGFGKSLTENLALINNLAIFHGLGCALLLGASRKRMIGALSKEEEADARLGGSLFLAMKAVEQGAHIIRVHDVPETIQAVNVWRGLRDAALTARV